MKTLEREVLLAFPEHPVQRMAFVSQLPVGWPRSTVDWAMKKFLQVGLIVRLGRGQYGLTDAGRAARAACRTQATTS